MCKHMLSNTEALEWPHLVVLPFKRCHLCYVVIKNIDLEEFSAWENIRYIK